MTCFLSHLFTLRRKTLNRPSFLLFGAIALCSCEGWNPWSPDSTVASGQFGVFYGSQLRERDEIPFELGPGRQQLGFRIEFGSKLKAPTRIHWELSKPGKRRRKTPSLVSPTGRVAKISSALVPEGASRFEQPIELEPGDSLGLWNIRVTHEKEVLIDRPFLVFDRGARRRAKAAARVPDAGP